VRENDYNAFSYSGFQSNAQVALSLTPRLIAVFGPSQYPSTVLTVSLCWSLILRFVVRRADVFGVHILAAGKTVETVSNPILSLVTAMNRGVNEKVLPVLYSTC
jgi:hypothetical protein